MLQIKAEEFQDSEDSEIGYCSEGGEREPGESELLVDERSSPVQVDSMAKEFAGTKPYLQSDNQTGLKLSSMQQKVCDEILFSKSPLKERAFKDDDLRSLPIVPEHFKYFKTLKCNDSLLSYLAQMREKAGKKPSTKIHNPVL